ncbi:hypothetical protein MSTO_12000 [Mycobacterium stomatepiae]|uniref:Uncharacterized protein n=1 Tax=Mycobacterium stomatepiae TaxID=470076 RepID=A0A7I7Q3R7_9MYCO|nr:hypothetical protein MSTO_12000 [Mycobacterium stomatepiae]
MQALPNMADCSAVAPPSDGCRFDGTALTFADAATAACTCANARRTAPSYGSAPRPVGGVTVTASVGAAGPRPIGSGTSTSSTTLTHTATAVAAPPTARLRPADRFTAAENRTGFSMKRRVSRARPAEMTTVTNLPVSPSGWPSNGAASSSTGQCHRYHE